MSKKRCNKCGKGRKLKEGLCSKCRVGDELVVVVCPEPSPLPCQCCGTTGQVEVKKSEL